MHCRTARKMKTSALCYTSTTLLVQLSYKNHTFSRIYKKKNKKKKVAAAVAAQIYMLEVNILSYAAT